MTMTMTTRTITFLCRVCAYVGTLPGALLPHYCPGCRAAVSVRRLPSAAVRPTGDADLRTSTPTGDPQS